MLKRFKYTKDIIHSMVDGNKIQDLCNIKPIL